jgi:hypothetical protein
MEIGNVFVPKDGPKVFGKEPKKEISEQTINQL